jgi:hypothetical protein
MKGNEEETGAGNDAKRHTEGRHEGGRLIGLQKRIGSKFRVMLDKRVGKDEPEPNKEEMVMEGKEAGDTDDKEPVEGAGKGGAGNSAGEPAGPHSEEAGNPKSEPEEDKTLAGKKEKPKEKPADEEEGKEREPAKEKNEAGSEKSEESHADEPDEEGKSNKGGKSGQKGKPGKKGNMGKKGKEATDDAGKKEEKPKESMSELIAQKDEIEALLSSIEDAYREATLPDKTYREVKSKNENKLEAIEEKMKALEAAGPAEAKEAIGEAAPEGPPAAGRPAVTAPARIAAPARAPSGEAQAPKPSLLPSVPVLHDLEKMIGERMKDAISAASLEMTDKRIRKVDERLESLESSVKEMKRTAETVTGYDKQFTVMNTEVEKTKALVESIKEAKNITDEKIQRMTESFAEIRSIVYQREAKAKEQEVVFDKIKDAVSQVDTARILREFTTRDEQMRDVNTRLEKLERSGKMLSDTMNKIKGLMTDVGSLENIMKASKLVGEKLERIQEIEERVKATSTRLASVYVDINKRLDEFAVYRVKQDKLDGMSADMVKNLEDVTRRLSDYATKDDIEVVKHLVSGLKEEAKRAAAKTTVELPPEAKLLQEEKEEIETLLSTLEENLRNKEISKEEYDSAKSKNLQRIEEIDAKIRSFSESAAKPGREVPAAGKEEKRHGKAMLLAKLKESYENGEISRSAYEKSKKMLLKK